ncbi:MAG: acetyl-CoA C-acyltransferase [Nitrospinaceae bacterium]|nr:thiolase family protein [Nitrospinaceae bacterium]NIR53480.1 thiolase family protein [Nitrospinaceae bacterium]NIS83878.1 thiolase family protein [Nitrospinaceae bacterium]NIT80677.1 thiolase family protein [Nitrospinaceae bacterium]NIU42997.1 thiolase family protein [Nitrospinaceae bacterium]
MIKDSFIYSALRTPLGKFNGGLASLPGPLLAAAVIPETLKRAGLHSSQVDEVLLGQVVQAGVGQAPARTAALQAGIPEEVPAATINKVCGSGMKTVMMADQAIRLGQAQFIVTGGMESMSRAPFLLPQLRGGRSLGHTEAVDSLILDGLWDAREDSHMGTLCERVAQDHCLSRERQDAYARTSYLRARQAREEGFTAHELVEVRVPHPGKTSIVSLDEQPFADDIDRLPFLKSAFDRKGGTITKGNGAKISDGAAILIVGGPAAGLQPLARIVGYATHAESPSTFALAPIQAIQKVLRENKLTIEDIDLFEINEAFAAMSLIVNDVLNLDPEKVNVHGGSIALGHPIGATGARILVTLIHALRTKSLKRGLASLCIGGGEATAMVVELM